MQKIFKYPASCLLYTYLIVSVLMFIAIQYFTETFITPAVKLWFSTAIFCTTVYILPNLLGLIEAYIFHKYGFTRRKLYLSLTLKLSTLIIMQIIGALLLRKPVTEYITPSLILMIIAGFLWSCLHYIETTPFSREFSLSLKLTNTLGVCGPIKMCIIYVIFMVIGIFIFIISIPFSTAELFYSLFQNLTFYASIVFIIPSISGLIEAHIYYRHGYHVKKLFRGLILKSIAILTFILVHGLTLKINLISYLNPQYMLYIAWSFIFSGLHYLESIPISKKIKAISNNS